MRVATYHGAGGPITIEQVADPRPEPDQVVVAVGRAGICGSDVSMTSGSRFDYAPGWRMGHEFAGEVVEVGSGVKGLRLGDRVACMPGAGCGTCAACGRGQFVFCPSVRAFNGGFGDFVAVAAASAVRLPESLSMADGALVEPMAVGLHAVNLARLSAGANLLVLGAGSMAMAVTYWAGHLGAGRITVVSRSEHRRPVAEAMGADEVISFDQFDAEGPASTVGSSDVIAECVGKEGMTDKAVQALRPGGTVISLGMCPQNEPLITSLCSFKEVRMFFPITYTLEEFQRTARVFDAGHVHPDIMVRDVISLGALPTTIESLRRRKTRTLKVQVDPSLTETGIESSG
jgi:threonine dehydrogenase-like Zn-dependent dehydrogenase